VGTKTITMYVSDIDQSEIPAGQAYQLSIRHPDGSTQQLTSLSRITVTWGCRVSARR